MKKLLQFIFFCLFIAANAHAITREALMDSVVTEAGKKIRESRAAMEANSDFKRSWINGEIFGSYTITIDFAKWTPNTTDTTHFYYNKPDFGEFQLTDYYGNTHVEDSINLFNHHYRNDPNYVAYYNIVLINFPFLLAKDPSSFITKNGDGLFTTLQAAKVLSLDSFSHSVTDFDYIIQRIADNYFETINTGKKVIVYGCAQMKGEYAPSEKKCAKFISQVVHEAGFTNEEWITDIYRLPKLLTPEKQVDLSSKNLQVALAVKQYIECNVYGVCHFDSNVFSNIQARYFFDNLKDVTTIDKSLLLRVASNLNALSTSTAWCILTIQHEKQFLEYFQNPLLALYPSFTDNDLNYFLDLIYKAKRGERQLRDNPEVTRDSIMYYGWILYRNEAFMKSIPVSQKILLMHSIVQSSCTDISGGGDIIYYENHCESIMMSLYHNINPGEEKTLLDLLKSTRLLWAITWRLDNSTLGFFGKDNYTDFIFTISNYWKTAYHETLAASKTSGVNFNTIKWQESFFNSNAYITTSPTQNKIVAVSLFREHFYDPNPTGATMDVYDPVLIDAIGHSDILGLNDGQQLLVPAFFLDFLSYKKTLADIGTTTQVLLATAGLLTGVGDLIEAGSIAMRAVGILETTIAASDLVLLNTSVQNSIISLFENPQDGRDFISEYQNITMLINGAVGLKGLVVSFTNDVGLYTLRFEQKELQLQTALGQNSVEFKGMKKLDEELGNSDVETELNSHISNGTLNVGDLIGGTYRINRIRYGSNGKIAIIGRNMKDWVIPCSEELKAEGKTVELFEESYQGRNSFIIDGQEKTYQQIKDDFKNLPDPVTGARKYSVTGPNNWITDEALPDTWMFKANQQWASKVSSEDYTIIEIGAPPNTTGISVFFNMETTTIFHN